MSQGSKYSREETIEKGEKTYPRCDEEQKALGDKSRTNINSFRLR